MKLEDFGWTPFFARALESANIKNHRAGRVFLASRDIYSAYTETGEVEAGIERTVPLFRKPTGPPSAIGCCFTTG